MGQTIGIDFGTTNTVVSYFSKNGKPTSLMLMNSKKTIPTAVLYLDPENYVIGTEAVNMSALYPRALAVSFKTDIESDTKWEIICKNNEKKKILPRKIAVDFMRSLIKIIEGRLIKYFGEAEGCIDNAVITVPARFSPAQKEAIKRAAMQAGFNQVSLAYEPTAAAAADYVLENCDNDRLNIVYDFGGGTFDVSAVRAHRFADYTEYREICTNGDRRLGGNVLTRELAEKVIERMERNGVDTSELFFDMDKQGKYPYYDSDTYPGALPYSNYVRSMREIVDFAENMKISYSDDDEYEGELQLYLNGDEGEEYQLTFSSLEVDRWLSGYIDRTVRITKQLIEEVVGNSDIKPDAIVLAGGSSNLPMISTRLDALGIDVRSGNSSTLIADGAIVLNKLEGQRSIQVTNCEYGIIENKGAVKAVFHPLIPVDVKLPFTSEEYRTSLGDCSQRIQILIYERDVQNYPGAQRIVDEGLQSVGRFDLKLPDDLVRSEAEVGFSLSLNCDGVFCVDVSLYESGKKVTDRNFEVSHDNLE